MSATIKGFVVTLEPDVRQEHANKIREAILQLKNVVGCEQQEEDHAHVFARSQVRHELGLKLIRLVFPEKP